LIQQQPVAILNSTYGNAATEFVTANLGYYYNCPMGDRNDRYAWHVNYQVRWYGTRDIYLDQVKVMDVYGQRLWVTDLGETEPRAFADLRDQVAAYYGNSPTILGWYQSDDASMQENRDNVLSVRRVDSLLGAWYANKKGFVVTGGGNVDYISLANYSNISFQWYPIYEYMRTSSEPYDSASLQSAWNYKISELPLMKELALAKGVPCYPLIQGFEGENGLTGDSGWRRPTAEEHLCMINLTLAYGADGIWYWKYYGCDAPTLAHCTDGLVCGNDVFADTATTWSQIKNVIGPYIEKMGPIFASIEWKGAWRLGDTPICETYIDSIACNQYGNAGQNPLYLQVAEFEPPSHSNDTAYFFLVNRRCLPTENITGTLFFNGFAGTDKGDMSYYVFDVLNGTSWKCDEHLRPEPPYSFDYSIPAGAGRLYQVSPRPPCRHGDANRDGDIDISDAVSLISHIFAGGAAPDPRAAGDANCDGAVDISDAVFLISYIFSNGAKPCEGC
jgi:hypothetical protein